MPNRTFCDENVLLVAQPSEVAISQPLQLLNSLNVASATRGCILILLNSNLNSHMGLVATIWVSPELESHKGAPT